MSGEEEAQEQQQQPQQEETPAAETAPEEAPLSGATTSSTPSTSTPMEKEEEEQKEEEEEVFTYRALVLTGHGGYDKVKLQVRSGKPAMQSGQVLVRMKACGLNFADLMGRQGLDELLPSPPVTMGMEGAGVVEEVHPDVTHRKVGDRVIVMNHHGLWQEVVAVAAENTFLMPEPMSFEEGAALPVNYLTAYLMLFEMANLRPGRSVLIHMAAGGVGIAATQLCQSVGDVTVFGTASASKHETIVQGGVAHPIDYRTKDYVEEIRKISPKGLDVVLDPLGGSDTQKGYGLLKPMGTLIVFGAANCVTGQKKSLLAMAKTWYNQLSLNTLKLMQANKAVCGFHLGYLNDVPLITATMDTLLGLYSQGKIKPCVDSSYHFEDVADAMRRMQERHNIGKVILLPEPKKKEEVVVPASNPEPEETEAGAEVDEKREEAVDAEGVAKDN